MSRYTSRARALPKVWGIDPEVGRDCVSLVVLVVVLVASCVCAG